MTQTTRLSAARSGAPPGGRVRESVSGRRPGTRRAVHVLGRFAVPALLAALFAAPLWFMVTGSLRPAGLPPPRTLEILPPEPTLAAYTRLPELMPLFTYLGNSALVVAIAVPVTVVVAGLTGFGIRLLSRTARRRVLVGLLVVLLVPVTAVWATRFEVFRLAGVVDTFIPLLAPALLAVSPFLILLYAWSFGGIPESQLQAARLEGASWLAIWRRLAMPQVRPATLAVAVLAFTFHWANFIDPLLYLHSGDRYTLPLGLQFLRLLNPTDWPLLMAGCVIATLPCAVVFLFAQRILLSDDPLAALRGGRR
ncbi:carbohydrate ABC transporter permease [Phytoactinopolyspora alkaliphila]|uniref:Carbohydrate ABC transporter permease n=1 Tax=Phytoactinopolyspora alkaliphila TaxID=1783498 RepID=A0A6N9YHF9_9ACTN|nr:carbohydrate ABC transporter permease [Phytoactinopolyspora alkaliphila]NED94392.1 carbohydrate ABC transporter permease [Phytoactinopolyspora alkaliphila]